METNITVQGILGSNGKTVSHDFKRAAGRDGDKLALTLYNFRTLWQFMPHDLTN